MDDVALGGVTLKKARFGEVGYEHGHAFRKGHFSGITLTLTTPNPNS